MKLWDIWISKYSLKLASRWATFANENEARAESLRRMAGNNPRIVLRNYLAELAIRAATKGDFSLARRLLEKLETPFSDDDVVAQVVLPPCLP